MRPRINFLSVFVISSIIYILFHIFFEDMVIYLIGGIIGSFLKLFSNVVSSVSITIVWIVLIGIFTSLVYYFKTNLNLLFLIIIGLLLYIVDFLMYEFIIEGYNNAVFKYAISILKGLILASICYKFSPLRKVSRL
jgi:hypothetical protein